MRQDQLAKESQKCHHGFYFGTTCYDCKREVKTYRLGFAAGVKAARAKLLKVKCKLKEQ